MRNSLQSSKVQNTYDGRDIILTSSVMCNSDGELSDCGDQEAAKSFELIVFTSETFIRVNR